MSFGLLFPGQGSQYVGMGTELFEARPDLLGEWANEIVGFDLRSLCLDGPEEALTRTEHAQPALFALSHTLWDMVAARIPDTPGGAAGHSLGEYTALVAAGFFDFEEGLRVVAARGQAMAAAASREPSGMAALIGADEETAVRLCSIRREMGGHLEVANLNAPGQVVVAGGAEDMDWLTENARDHGVRRAIPLQVAGAFHTQYMSAAADALGDVLAGVEPADARFPVWSNTTARAHEKASLKETLVRQVVAPVRFSESLENMASAGIRTFIHVGPGDVTAGLARRTLPDVEVLVISELSDIRGVAADLGTMSGR